MIKPLPLILFLLFLCLPLDAENIVKIEGSNLFVLKNGQKIRLANVRTPSLADSSSAMKALAKRIMRYAKAQLINKKLKIEFTSFRDDSGYTLTHIYQLYPLEKRNMNAVFLEKGFGWFVDNADSVHKARYMQAEEKAQRKYLGVWNPDYPVSTITQQSQLAFFLGALKGQEDGYNEQSDYYQEALLELTKKEEQSALSIRLGAIRHVETGRGCCECALPPEAEPQPYHHTSLMFYGGVRLQMMSDFMGFNLGMSAAYNARNYCSEGNKYFIVPTLGIKIGRMKKVYLTADLFDEFILPVSVGLRYIFDRKASDLWIGMMRKSKTYHLYALKANYAINGRWVLKVHGLLSYPSRSFGLRLGLGRMLGQK